MSVIGKTSKTWWKERASLGTTVLQAFGLENYSGPFLRGIIAKWKLLYKSISRLHTSFKIGRLIVFVAANTWIISECHFSKVFKPYGVFLPLFICFFPMKFCYSYCVWFSCRTHILIFHALSYYFWFKFFLFEHRSVC